MNSQTSAFQRERYESNEWFKTPLGKVFLEEESKIVGELINDFSGNYLLCLGEEPFVSVIQNSFIKHRVWVHPKAKQESPLDYSKYSSLVSRQDKLPIGNDEVHVVYLAHCLENNRNPHEVLRESFRVMVPEGHLVLTGFNTWGMWAIRKRFTIFNRELPWTGKFLSLTRLKDWLALLGFDIVTQRYYFFRPPVKYHSILSRIKWMETIGKFLWPIFGGSYVVLAKKRVVTLTPIRPKWSVTEKLLVPGLVEPSTRNPG